MYGGRQPRCLIELLIVIAIIALLMSLLMPAQSRAREMGRRTVCLSNQRQCVSAAHLFAKNNSGNFPGLGRYGRGGGLDGLSVTPAGAHIYTGMGRLYEEGYLGSAEVFYCPSARNVYWEYDGEHGWERGFSTRWVSSSFMYQSFHQHQVGVSWGRPFRNTDDGSAMMTADWFILANGGVNHQQGFNVVHLDGSGNWVHDSAEAVAILPRNTLDWNGLSRAWDKLAELEN